MFLWALQLTSSEANGEAIDKYFEVSPVAIAAPWVGVDAKLDPSPPHIPESHHYQRSRY